MNDFKQAFDSVATQYKNLKEARGYAAVALKSLITRLQDRSGGQVVFSRESGFPQFYSVERGDFFDVHAVRVRDNRVEVFVDLTNNDPEPGETDTETSSFWLRPDLFIVGFEDELLEELKPIIEAL